MEHIFQTLLKTFSSLDPFYQGHMQSLPNTTSQRQLTFLQFTCSPGSHKITAPIEAGEEENQAEKKQWGHEEEEEEESTGKGWPQFCVFGVLPQLYLVQQNTSHIKGSYLDRQGRLSRGKRSLTAQKHCCTNLLVCTVCCLLDKVGSFLYCF